MFSLTYTIQNFYFLGCEYSNHFPRDTYAVCHSGSRWPYALLLCLPALVRLIQCVKRWHDSRLAIHLINAGKYLISIVQLCLFVLWRARGRSTSNASFIVWVLVSTATSVYTSAWDLIVDWSLFRPQSGLLRHDRGYSSRYVYYFAMASNVLIRFIWVWYIPDAKQYPNSRSFYFALAEMLRRWQWNFFRVETEHLGNADAYRVTREIPLPYRRIEHDSDEDDKQPELFRSKTNPITVHLDRLRRELVGEEQGRGPDAENLGPRGHARQREYEARRPGDTESDEPVSAA
ncbi:EXS-domain-containing protein [Papiliotrema laurentii]|uniref:EXS-domain-containing protein n=1 Tax=Papiliotrema laurentii TaxID=5418 RepID=A0AAD9CV55_PAPLA|nr:EXS-domain-containing protein [Papiliotrema laurentii]